MHVVMAEMGSMGNTDWRAPGVSQAMLGCRFWHCWFGVLFVRCMLSGHVTRPGWTVGFVGSDLPAGGCS